MKTKENLFFKNNTEIEIEELLDNKHFCDEAKSLILNTIYKIENSYRDYCRVKASTKLKNEIISDIIEKSIKNNCERIQITNPKQSKSKFVIDRKNKILKSFPKEINLLEGLNYLRTPNYKNNADIFEKATSFVLGRGMALNAIEIIRDFDGWSWNNAIDNESNKYYNLIFQDLSLLLGESVINEIACRENPLKELSKKIEENYGEKKKDEYIFKLAKVCILLYQKIYSDDELKEYLKTQRDYLYQLSNKSKYMDDLKEKVDEDNKYIEKVTAMLENNELLNAKLKDKKIYEKYKTLDAYKAHLRRIRYSRVKNVNRYKKLLNPFEYTNEKNMVTNNIAKAESIIWSMKRKDCLHEAIVDLQRKNISFYSKKIEVCELKKELINLIYEIRYYNLLPINDYHIKDMEELSVDLRNLQKKLTMKLIKNKIIESFSNDSNIDYLVTKYIYNAKLININKILIKMSYKNKKLNIQYFDDEELENEEILNVSEDEFNELTKKANKKIRIFV